MQIFGDYEVKPLAWNTCVVKEHNKYNVFCLKEIIHSTPFLRKPSLLFRSLDILNFPASLPSRNRNHRDCKMVPRLIPI